MMLLINNPESIKCEMCIDLRGRNIGVAQNGLHGPEIGAVLDHVCGAGMA